MDYDPYDGYDDYDDDTSTVRGEPSTYAPSEASIATSITPSDHLYCPVCTRRFSDKTNWCDADGMAAQTDPTVFACDNHYSTQVREHFKTAFRENLEHIKSWLNNRRPSGYLTLQSLPEKVRKGMPHDNAEIIRGQTYLYDSLRLFVMQKRPSVLADRKRREQAELTFKSGRELAERWAEYLERTTWIRTRASRSAHHGLGYTISISEPARPPPPTAGSHTAG